MSTFPESSSNPRHSDRSPAMLQAGVAALKRQDYADAIVKFQSAHKTTGDKTIRAKAQVGLVKAYAGAGKVKQAIELCRPLCSSRNAQLKQWAVKKLVTLSQAEQERAELEKSSAEGIVDRSTGGTTAFQPSQTSIQSVETLIQEDEAVSLPKDEAGFGAIAPDERASTESPPIGATTDLQPSDTFIQPVETFIQQDETVPSPSDETGFVAIDPELPPAETALTANEPQLANLELLTPEFYAEDETGFEAIDELSPSREETIRPVEPVPATPLSAFESTDETGFTLLDLDESRVGAIESPPHPAYSPSSETAPPSIDIPPSEENEFSLGSFQTLTGDAAGVVFTPATNLFDNDPSNEANFNPLPERDSQAVTPLPAKKADSIAQSVSNSMPSPPAHSILSLRNAGRAQKWNSLGQVDLSILWGVEALTAIALILVLLAFVQIIVVILNWFILHITWPIDWREAYIHGSPLFWVILVTAGLVAASGWGMGKILLTCYDCRPLTLGDLEYYSPEAVRLLNRTVRQRRIPLPTLKQLPDAAPMAFTYGLLPQQASIVVTRGLLEQLNDSEIAAVIAAELAHIIRKDFIVLSPIVFIAQLPYLIYSRISPWGDRQTDRVLQTAAAVGVGITYGLFRAIRWSGLWLARVRSDYSDRLAAELTGNPNALTRALLKMTVGMAEEIRSREQTSLLLESFDLLLPVSPRHALSWGDAYCRAPIEPQLIWDRVESHRWLAINSPNVLMGDRLFRLSRYARHWRLEQELNFGTIPAPSSHAKTRLLLQSAPFLGGVLGISIALFLWLVGSVANRFGLLQLAWMAGDRTILWGCLLTCLSLGTILRINPFFPDIKPSTVQVEPDLLTFLTDPQALPLDSYPVRLQGRLIGRRGIRNLFAQDLALESQTGLIKLHYQKPFGPLSSLLPFLSHPFQAIGKSVTVTGWFRRGATCWVDVHTLQPQGGRAFQGGHPIWSTILALLFGVAGALVILSGGEL